jgi:predicted enzyme related to lactoylglutathione lyase
VQPPDSRRSGALTAARRHTNIGEDPWRRLDAIVAQLRTAGVSVTIDPETYPNGRFARLSDPEGNPVELWEPGGRDGHAAA